MSNKKVINNQRMVFFLFMLCWAAYFVTYLGRLNFSSAIPEMIKTGILTKSSAGVISTLFFAFYGGGQLINGYLGDKFPPRILTFIGLFVSALCNVTMGISTNIVIMSVSWAINGYAQSMIWPAIVRVFSQMLDQKTMVKCCINIVSTIACGTLMAYIMSAFTIEFWGHQAPFITAGTVLVIMSVVWYIGCGKVDRYYDKHGEIVIEERQAPVAQSQAHGGKKISVAKLLISSGAAIIIVPVVIHGILKDGVTNWVPTFISETFNTSAMISVLVTIALPIVNLSGAYIANYVNTKLVHDEKKTSAVFFVVSFLSISILAIWGKQSIVLTIAMLAITTSSMLAVNTMLINVLPLSFAQYGKSATISGIFNAFAYVGTAVSTYGIGYIADHYGWGVSIVSWAVLTIIAAIILLWKKKPRDVNSVVTS